MPFHVPFEHRHRPNQPIYIGFDVPPRRRKHNWTGFWGFMLSLFSFATAGFLAPIGLLVSLWGLRRKPRGFAAAGVVTGLAGTLLAGSLVGALLHHEHEQASRREHRANLAKVEATNKVFDDAAGEFAEFADSNAGVLPDPITANMLAIKYEDAWGRSIRFDADKGGANLRSSGPDGRFDTSDDVTCKIRGEVDQSLVSALD